MDFGPGALQEGRPDELKRQNSIKLEENHHQERDFLHSSGPEVGFIKCITYY